ncbi:protein phosphatase 1 regulatory subunit 29 [Trachemys scripta elegans]|uniref:Extracellular leucine rich repeat and fibronectin type III domain containing 2 n=1 Tax=Terrapene triunguis TaxID=2587831 RepID=A0A674IIS9_9SAUR|nr:protein phosphatase 1 regulatory subunit 29 [Terrapene carolina triunguis]XP_024055904.1 protein phosphatase 1 regulatory subunit 29 [Terrapene carolina triunguis]XP_024055905.1 protein phosphatase 1 regulatory subunit 29 [Terrapene carolina triunguis]XP_024055906.1 protein phosphatase 1 regulatory subunit 29 [Terrapene carolina triunguis]XP_024055907.1 protein phosphatase 1 regulatory subunit 29 [Terrapene carolina triunguis]XP_034633056.1 protein phosphatase 1 regulatory subunit 29 [Trach
MLRLGLWAAALLCVFSPGTVHGDCWLIEGDKGYVWLAICSQNQPPYETIPQHINSTVHDLRLNENKLKVVLYSSLNRFSNLTDLNLTKNEISYIEDGAFMGQANLQVLQLGYNKLTNLTEGMLRGMARLQFLFVQHNLIEVVTPTAFSECPSLISIDLSSNRLSRLEGNTFTSLSNLMVCELAGNPFNCDCSLYSFLTWLVVFNNVTKNYDRLQCETPREFAGYPLLMPRPHHNRNAITIFQSMCRGGTIPSLSRINPTPYTPDSQRDLDENSGFNPGDFLSVEPPASSTTDSSFNPSIKLHHVTITSATLVVTIPSPFSKMYVLVQYNNSYVSDVTTLKNKKEYVTLSKLKAHTDYTFCVASIRNSKRYNHTCLSFATRSKGREDPVPNTSTTTHYIMTILGCLFGMVIVLGVVYYCLRKRRMQEEKQKSLNVKKTILEMRYGSDIDTSSIVHSSQKLGEPPVIPVSRMSSIPSMIGEKLPPSKSMEAGMETPKVTTKGNYIEVRTGGGDALERAQRDDDLRELDNGQGSAAEISTIAKEVDKVNQIINNCIDALKLDTASFLGGGSGVDSDMAFECQSIPAGSSGGLERPGFLSPPYKESSHHPLQRQLSADAAVARKTCSVSSSGSIKSAKVFSLDVPDHPPMSKSDSKYIEKGSPLNSPLDRLPLVSPGAIHHLEVKPSYHCSEHRHSFPALYYEESADTLSQRVSFLKPLSRSKRDSTYSQLSPRHYFSGYSSSPEYSSESTHKIWERFRPYKKHHREEVYMAAGHALRKKVQFAKDEDLHDILDYWKGVSAQQKL